MGVVVLSSGCVQPGTHTLLPPADVMVKLSTASATRRRHKEVHAHVSVTPAATILTTTSTAPLIKYEDEKFSPHQPVQDLFFPFNLEQLTCATLNYPFSKNVH